MDSGTQRSLDDVKENHELRFSCATAKEVEHDDTASLVDEPGRI